MNQAETIYALASGIGVSGLQVFRISGPQSGAVLKALTGHPLPSPRMATYTKFVQPDAGTDLDQGLILWFPAPASYTGEDVAEVHAHGGRAVRDAFLTAFSKVSGVRQAEPGEFTRRAFENSKLDLTEVEGLADLIEAETDAQRRQALRQMQGALGRLYESWREDLIKSLAHVEAVIDFADEELPEELDSKANERIARVLQEIQDHLADGHRGELLRDGVSLAIIGPPNAGKSSFLNHLAQRDVAIVSSEPGTTRDIIEVHLDLAGYPVVVADTAGLREGQSDIESEGIRRALERANNADLKIYLCDQGSWSPDEKDLKRILDDQTFLVVNKMDLGDIGDATEMLGHLIYPISVRTGDGIGNLLSALEASVSEQFEASESPALTRERHRNALEECQEFLQSSLSVVESEFRAEELRLGVRALARITGRVDVEDLLDVIFNEFCIGK
ncbi:MAG: tRNA uridine-5-carboxymethylaminomethyl(34) synthesis GTPase MnmE [Rhodospirillaceae bacterium]|jgi:tRNA modification GTPase|nr:tRNA uridine-5-carboxymethylaminomethyl(34) synthesis GTPase MnmE [Rhodospirillaceae bacterium]MBT7488270.1 tRNA uridine-5-carboxymethylaminomethyl(34) synthesis GTPase MnmE [Rhodospirillales bacterium]MBT4701387.1 tRNA uridine-5-carboxymethylaminomethyl(34) synthesis GTPase MnmE [Rhodospirillaceae bacterium]MBT5036215.1 tRNA uridine-5-carboxymethylaminomethyl(34) synthesis GTPase MnmE [Rhodospirillaceae bacterium]MBT6220721.1 tRNA uridine-5-carboxymethylaminomethyl(34) synthesis GTPase MnmE